MPAGHRTPTPQICGATEPAGHALPAGQTTPPVIPALAQYIPAHASHKACPERALMKPGGHGAAVSKPVPLLKLPAGANKHRAMPILGAKEPGAQGTHAAAEVAAIAALAVPLVHKVHVDWPSTLA